MLLRMQRWDHETLRLSQLSRQGFKDWIHEEIEEYCNRHGVTLVLQLNLDSFAEKRAAASCFWVEISNQTHRHYAHLQPSYVADTIRAKLPNFGVKQFNIESL